MHAIPQLAVSTLLLGGVYALIAVGLTLIFGVMRVVNFAHGEFLMLAMYLAFWTFALLQLDPYVTLVLALPLVFAIGLASYQIVMRPVIHASHNVQVFTTVGLSIALQNVALVLWTADAQFIRTSYYAVVVRLGSAALNLAQLVAFVVAVLATAALFAFLRWSYTGKVMRATAQDRQAASLMGIDTGRVYSLTWAVGVTCVGVAGMLLAPIYPVYPTVGPPVRADRLRRGRAGRARRHGGRAHRQPDRRRRRGRRLLRDRHRMEGGPLPAPLHRDPRGPPRRPLRPARRRGDRHVRGALRRPSSSLALAALAPVVVRDAFFLDGLVLILLWGAAASAWNVAGGYAGQVSLGHSAFFGLGAYSAALLGTRWSLSPWIALLVGAGLATAFGFVHRLPQQSPARPVLRARHDRVLPGAADRRQPVARLHLRVRGHSRSLPARLLDARHRGQARLGRLVLVLAVVVYLVELYLERSRRGYQLAAVREDEDAALSLGVPALRLKVAAIAASAALTAVAGALWAQYVGFVDPFYVFSIDLSLRFALAAILGGIGTPLGPFLGAALISRWRRTCGRASGASAPASSGSI